MSSPGKPPQVFEVPDRNPGQLEGLNILVLGLGVHGGGTELIHYLHSKGARLTISDSGNKDDLNESLQDIERCAESIFIGPHEEEQLEGIDWVVVNPAIPPHAPFLKKVFSSGVRVVSELGLFLAWCPREYLAAVSGTNGKSTVCELTRSMLSDSGIPAVAGGNLGGSLLGMLDGADRELRWIVEISSFQLDRLGPLCPRPSTVAITNFSEDHLDWHGSRDAYLKAKFELLKNPDPSPGYAILPDTGQFGIDLIPQLEDFEILRSTGETTDPNEFIIPQQNDTELSIPYRPSQSLQGPTGRKNAHMAATLARHLGASSEGISTAIQSFSGLPHRFQLIETIKGVTYIDDSKATTPDSAQAALSNLSGKIYWLCGGKSKGLSLLQLSETASDKNIEILGFGSSNHELKEAFSGVDSGNCFRGFEDLEAAFKIASSEAAPGDTVLLSPGYPSFDQYLSFEARGQHFKKLVGTLGTYPNEA